MKIIIIIIIIIIIFWSFDFSFVLLREGFPFMYWSGDYELYTLLL